MELNLELLGIVSWLLELSVGIEVGLHQILDYKRDKAYFLQIFTLRPSISAEKIYL